jgi:hypothetical protein
MPQRSRRARAGLQSAHIRLVFPVPCRSTKGRARERRETKQLLSSPKVIEEADKVARLIGDYYAQPNKTFSELREMAHEHSLDPLREFSEFCREELQGLAPSGWRTSA